MVSKIVEALEKVDVLVTTGSVSMGDRDMLKPILQNYFNATIHFGIYILAFSYLSKLNIFKDFLEIIYIEKKIIIFFQVA